MAGKEDSDILKKIQETYVPFLKKLIGFLEKSKKVTQERQITKIKAIYTVFTTAPPSEQVETFHVNEKKLENWFNKAGLTKEKAPAEKEEVSTPTRRSKRTLATSDTESSQSACDSTQPSSKKSCTFTNSVDSDSSQPSILMVQSVSQPESSSQSTSLPVDILKIKKEKAEKQRAAQPQVRRVVRDPTPPPAPAPPPSPPACSSSADADEDDEVYDNTLFTCASCQFHTKDEGDFMKHARTDHRTDLSMWCKHCGKCFSNAGVLIAHIKEKYCFKEEMLYKCGVKDCVFETNSGQTFVHHLRHCHKGSPFIFCVHCQKIFTLPHCLILHMQDDCPFKMRNRANPGPERPRPASMASTSAENPGPATQGPSVATSNRQQTPKATYGVLKSIAPRSGSVLTTPARASAPLVGISRGRGSRGRGRGRGRGRVVISESSDSDDADDPSWRPEEILTDANVRRSARWAKKLNDCLNPEPSTSGVSFSSAKKPFKSFVDADINKKMIKCPCCEFMAAFQSVLEDHYIASHKVPNKNACLVCHLKFESVRAFLDHFEEHRNGSLPNGPPPQALDEPETSNISQQRTPVRAEIPAVPAPVTTPEENNSNSSENSMPNDSEPLDEVLTSISDSKLVDPAACRNKTLKIPYQAAIHDRNNKDTRLKKFEEFKSPNDLIAMKTIQKLQHFFKCALYACTFTSNSMSSFADHLKSKHQGKRYHCCYCFKEELNGDMLAKHIVFKHNSRVHQCSKCFYRACTKSHLQIHIKNYHSQELYTEILECDSIDPPNNVTYQEESTEEIHTTWPYICAIGSCDFYTYSPRDFKQHNEKQHRTVSIYYCFYCKVDFLTLKRLTNHYRLHGINKFQCNYCVHGSETKEEMLNHLCNAHADDPLKAFMRASQEEASSEAKQLSNAISETSNGSDYTQLYSVKHNVAVQNNAKGYETEKTYTGYEDKLYHVIENACYPSHMHNSCFPRYMKNPISDIICGIPFCNEKLESFDLYMSHLRKVHDALNFPCPHCPEMIDSWEDFRDHLLCHASKLYACGVEECGYYDWNKDKVREHKKQHLTQSADSGPIAIREFASLDYENKLHCLSLKTEFPDSKDYLMCLFCKYKCNDENVMKNHMYRELAYLRFDCCLCEKKCFSRKDIRDHFINCHPDIDISCSYDYNIEIEAHVKYILQHKNKFKYVKLTESCDMCCKKFKNPLRLQSHLFLCLQKEYRPYECTHCKKYFPSVLVLRYHLDEEHESRALEFTFESNYAIQDDIEKNLLKVRLRQLKDVFEENGFTLNSEEICFNVKFYTCSECSYEAHHKHNVQRHNQLKHGGAAKVMKGIETNVDSNNLPTLLDENSNDDYDFAKRYSCGYCIKKLLTTHEVDMHMRKAHTVNKEYFYYFTPDINIQYSAGDKEIYECAYCKSTRENLFSLKKHTDLMHSEMEFRVKGFVFSSLSRNSLACGYCYLKVGSPSELHAHSTSSHPLLALKSFGDFQTNTGKHGLDASDDIPNKRVKFGSTVFVCSHCGGAFATQELVTAHSRKAHSRINLEYTTKEQSVDSKDSADFRFYKCEFCKFTSEKQYLDKHLALKHKMRVKCSYCSKRFEYASKLKEHHDEAHKGLPLKYSQETISSGDSNSVGDKNDMDDDDENVSHYKKKPEPVDLSSITVRMETKEGQSANLPLLYVTERFNLFPKVILTDIMKNQVLI